MKRTLNVQLLPTLASRAMWLATMLLVTGFVTPVASADETEYVSLSDVTGKFKLEAKILGIAEGKVQLHTKDGRTINVALNKLSPASLKLVEAATSANKPAAGQSATAPKDIPYKSYSLHKNLMGLYTSAMQAEGVPVGKPASGTIQVSDSLAVSNVPVSFIQALAARKLIHLKALGLVAEGDEANRPAMLKALAMDLALPTIAASGGAESLTAEKPEPLLAVIRADGSLAATLIADNLPIASPNLLRLSWNIEGGVQDHLPLAHLLKRFDSTVLVTEENAIVMAEELAWTQTLKISDGSYKSLADTRQALQAAILEVLQFKIGDPQDEDPARQKQARAQLQTALTAFQQTWDEGFAEPAKSKK